MKQPNDEQKKHAENVVYEATDLGEQDDGSNFVERNYEYAAELVAERDAVIHHDREQSLRDLLVLHRGHRPEKVVEEVLAVNELVAAVANLVAFWEETGSVGALKPHQSAVYDKYKIFKAQADKKHADPFDLELESAASSG